MSDIEGAGVTWRGPESCWRQLQSGRCGPETDSECGGLEVAESGHG